MSRYHDIGFHREFSIGNINDVWIRRHDLTTHTLQEYQLILHLASPCLTIHTPICLTYGISKISDTARI